MDNICRTCLTPLHSLEAFKITHEIEVKYSITEALVNFAEIKVSYDDNLPQSICVYCKDRLVDITKFRNQVINSDRELRAIHFKPEIVLDVKKDDILTFSTLLDDHNEREEVLVNENVSKKTFTCSICGKNFIKRINFKKHLTMHLRKLKDGSTETEDVCSQLEVIIESLGKEVRSLVFKCKDCDKTYSQQYQLKRHAIVHSGEKLYACDVCSKAFARKWSLRLHQTVHSGLRPYQCEECGKSFGSPGSLTSHKRIHKEEKSYICTICNKGFHQKSNLDIHIRNHTGEKPYLCDICSKTFKNSGALSHHVKTHDPDSKACCQVCGKYYSKFSISDHIKRHIDDRKHGCTLCSKTFLTATILKQHMRVHDHLKPFKCKICGKAFAHGGTLTKHKRVHTGEKPFSCTFCKKAFAYKHHMQTHIKKDHFESDDNTTE